MLEGNSFIYCCLCQETFSLFPFFFFPYMVSLTYRALGKLVIFLYFSRAGSFFPYPCLISASRRIKHFKKFPNSSNMEYFWRSQGGHLPPLAPTWLRLCLYPLGDGFEGIPSLGLRYPSIFSFILDWKFELVICIFLIIELGTPLRLA